MDQKLTEFSPFYITIEDMCQLLHNASPPSLRHVFSRYANCEEVIKGLIIFVTYSDPSMVEYLFSKDQISGVNYNYDISDWQRNWQWVLLYGHHCSHSDMLPPNKAMNQLAFTKSKAVKISRALNDTTQPFLGAVIAFWISKLYLATGVQFAELPKLLQVRYMQFVLEWKHYGWSLLRPALPFTDEKMTYYGMTVDKFRLAILLERIHTDRKVHLFKNLYEVSSLQGHNGFSTGVVAVVNKSSELGAKNSRFFDIMMAAYVKLPFRGTFEEFILLDSSENKFLKLEMEQEMGIPLDLSITRTGKCV